MWRNAMSAFSGVRSREGGGEMHHTAGQPIRAALQMNHAAMMNRKEMRVRISTLDRYRL